MTFPPSATLDARSDEISARTGFSGNRLRRDGELRTAESLMEALARPDARVFLALGAEWLCRTSNNDPDPAFSIDEARALGAMLESAILLGFGEGGAPSIAAVLAEGSAPPVAEGLQPTDLRTLAVSDLLDPDTEGQLGQAAHLIGWHRRNGFCARCGGPTLPEAAGFRRRCTRCDDTVFPRIEPVAIMLVHDGAGRCVLGRQPRFADKFWSCLAGFIEAGETVEDAVRRETLEEAGLEVSRVTYLASQPWPFPGSLMIGCVALAATSDIVFDGQELEACRWFDREEVAAMLENRHADGLTLPKRYAIAHHLIRAFAAGDI